MNYSFYRNSDGMGCCEMSTRAVASGSGKYVSKTYTRTVVTICSINGVTLTKITDATTRYEIYSDGEFFDRYTDLQIAKAFFKDFAGITARRMEALMKEMH